MIGRLALIVVGGLVMAASAAQAAVVQDDATVAGIAQDSQSFDTLVWDYNLDGIPDFLYSPQNGPLDAGRQLWQGNADGTFTHVTNLVGGLTTDQHGCTSGDYDGNGLPDAYCVLGGHYGTRTKANDLFLQASPGVFVDDVASGAEDPLGRGYSATTLDANGDGLPDLFVDNKHPRPDGQPSPNRLFLNLGIDPLTGAWLGFADDSASGLESEQGRRGCDLTADFNYDGRPDIVFCGTGTLRFYQNNGDGTFTDVHAALLGGDFLVADAELVDVNKDGFLDLVFVKLSRAAIRFGQADGTFAPPRQFKPLTAGRTVEVTDVNGDGFPDLYLLQGNGPPGCTIIDCPINYPDSLYLNDGFGRFTTPISVPDAAGSGDTVDAIGPRLIVGNGANLTAGPLQLISLNPAGVPPDDIDGAGQPQPRPPAMLRP
jgi:hypothetical protein